MSWAWGGGGIVGLAGQSDRQTDRQTAFTVISQVVVTLLGLELTFGPFPVTSHQTVIELVQNYITRLLSQERPELADHQAFLAAVREAKADKTLRLARLSLDLLAIRRTGVTRLRRTGRDYGSKLPKATMFRCSLTTREWQLQTTWRR